MPRGIPMARSAVDKSRTHIRLARLLISTTLTSIGPALIALPSLVLLSAALNSNVLAPAASNPAVLTPIALTFAALASAAQNRRRSSELATEFLTSSPLDLLPVSILNDSPNFYHDSDTYSYRCFSRIVRMAMGMEKGLFRVFCFLAWGLRCLFSSRGCSRCNFTEFSFIVCILIKSDSMALGAEMFSFKFVLLYDLIFGKLLEVSKALNYTH